MTNPDLFVATDRADNRDYLISPNAIFLVSTMRPASSPTAPSIFPNDAPENLGWDLGWNREKLFSTATLDTIVVDPDYRGHGLQRMLIQTCVSYAREILPSCNVMTTVSPYNEYSLRNVQAEGLYGRKRLMKYGGHERFILGSIPDAERNTRVYAL